MDTFNRFIHNYRADPQAKRLAEPRARPASRYRKAEFNGR